ncbi:uncharacterized protein LACBIDRAFT_309692 [Laccaria bicolor S238N-H82]|uniref:Predicted protein n=1 Tax=Laccaria bicolor (strain S238N-H82 / ATCC MYA-4686) TaxID=486041 RepID=B0DSV0_LACBS|nr:uncharacterized protein LACBIDRAFT_309692 [Laccaria bicolor S238N-H82]EDR02305.1 predicted protein [Laccaria bicolor S238N-H82]|eukprot:XP_001886982.1 predicted protein [Laccaria bicolor S238N-H82]
MIPDPLRITSCTGEGTPMAIIPLPSPARKRRLEVHPIGERGSPVFCLTLQSGWLVFCLLSTRSHSNRYSR